MRRKGIFFVVSAPSGAGKTSLCRDVSGQTENLEFSISHTTRPPRPGEVDGKDYFFIPEDVFKQKCDHGDFIEWAKVHGHLYGTSRSLLSDRADRGIDVILDIDSQGAMILKRQLEGGIYIYILPPSLDSLKVRLLKRGLDSSEEISRRLQKAKDEIRHHRQYHYLIVNQDYEAAKNNLNAVILAERVRMRQADHQWIEDTFIRHFEDA